MPGLNDAVNAFLPVVNRLQPRLQTWLATAGDGHGTIDDPNQINHIFVRVLNNAVGTAPSVQTISVYNDVGLFNDGDRCIIGFSHDRPRLLHVLSKQDQRYDAGTDTTIVNNIGLLPHGWQHGWLKPDPVFIDFFQVLNLGVYPAGGLTVAIKRGLIPRVGVDILVADQTLDLTANQPATGALWALLSVSPAGAIVVTLSATVGSIYDLNYTIIPDTPAGNFRLAAVALFGGQAAIELNATRQDIFDLRWPQENSPDALGFGTAQYQYIVTGATPFAPMWSTGFLNITATKTLTINNSLTLSGTDGGAVSFAVTNTKTLTLTATDNYNLTIPKTGTATVGTGTAGRIAEWVTDANTLQASSLIKTGAGILTIDAGSTQTIAFGGSNGGTLTFGAASKTLTINDSIILAGGGNTLMISANLTTTGGATTLALGATGRTYTFSDVAGTVALGAGTLTNSTTNDVTVAAHTHAIAGSPALLGDGTAQYQYIVTGATPFAPAWSAGFLNITAAKTLTVTDSITLVGGGNTFTLNASLTWPADAAGVLTNNGAGVLTWGASGGAHTIFSATHTDTLIDSVMRGDLVVGNATPKVARLPLGGSAKSFVTRDASDVVWSTGMLDLTTGKTLTVSNSLTLSGMDGKSLGLTGSLSIGADTSITGGGTIALGGFTLTIPASGTAALGAGTLTVSTTNDVTGSAHTHAITSSSNPGVAASLLATDASGTLTLKVLNLTGGSDTVLNYSNGGLYSYSTLLWLAAGTPRTITLPDLDGTVALGAGTATVSSTNSVAVASHTHAVTTSSNPGAAAAILASDASGNLTIAGTLKASGTTDSTSATTGALQSAGGLGIAKVLWVGGNANIDGSLDVRGAYINLSVANPTYLANRLVATTGTNAVGSSYENTGGRFFVGRDTSTSSAVTGSGRAYDAYIWVEDNHALAFATNNTARITIAAGGDVTFANNILVTGKITTYNNVATEGYGVGAIVDDVALTNQGADIGSTNFTNAGVAGTYAVMLYIYTTTTDAAAGSVSLTLAWNDGIARSKLATVIDLTSTALGTGQSSGIFPVKLSTGSISYSTSHTGSYGTAKYAVYMSCIRLS